MPIWHLAVAQEKPTQTYIKIYFTSFKRSNFWRNTINSASEEILSFIGSFIIFSIADFSSDHYFQQIKVYWLENLSELQTHYQDNKQQVMPKESFTNTLFVTFYPDLNIQNVSAQFANDRFSFWYIQWHFLDPQLVNKNSVQLFKNINIFVKNDNLLLTFIVIILLVVFVLTSTPSHLKPKTLV